MSQQSAFKWAGQRELAAQLTAEDRLSDVKIAEQCGVDRKTLQRWRAHPDFMARVDAINAAFKERVGRFAIAQRERRVAALNDRWKRLHSVMDARAAGIADDVHDPLCLGTFRDAAKASGVESGLVTVEWVTTPRGSFRPQFKVDTALSAEMRNLEKQAGQELGQWVEKIAPTTPDGAEPYTPVDFSTLSDEDLDDLERLRKKLDGAGGAGPADAGRDPRGES